MVNLETNNACLFPTYVFIWEIGSTKEPLSALVVHSLGNKFDSIASLHWSIGAYKNEKMISDYKWNLSINS